MDNNDALFLSIAHQIMAIASISDSKIKFCCLENKPAISCSSVNDFSDFMQELTESTNFMLLRINKVAKSKAELLIKKIKSPANKRVNGENIYYWSWLTLNEK